jgi:glycosyltransferase involved in cell wall biosynthesis
MGTVAYHQARSLARAGDRVTVFTPRAASARLKPEGVEVIELPPLGSRGNAACLPQVLRAARHFDVLHLHYPFFGTAELVAARRAFGRPPLVLQYQMDVFGEGWRAHAFRWHRRMLLPLVLGAADQIIVTSEDYARSSFLADSSTSLHSKLNVVPGGVDTTTFRPLGQEASRQALGLPEAPIVLFLSRLDRAHYFKGLHRLVDAILELPEVTLVVGGDGEMRSQYQGQATALLGSRAVFVGDIPDAELPAYYNAADVVVLPSVDRTEAFGLVLLEAMACATPVVAARLPGVRTLVQEGVNGYLADPRQPAALAAAIDKAIHERAALSLGARASAAAFDWEAITRRLRDVYAKSLR